MTPLPSAKAELLIITDIIALNPRAQKATKTLLLHVFILDMTSPYLCFDPFD
jgi:hypothetical protein